MHVNTLRNAFVHVITYCLSVIPIYWAFVIFGVLNFGPFSEKFSSVGQTIITLFSLLNGDDIYATFQEIEEGQYPAPIISRIYIICFVTLFVTSVLNVFIFIIEDSYRTAKLSIHNINSNPWQNHVVSNSNPEDALITMQDNSFTPKEILQIIFHNLEVWNERMSQFPVAFGIESENYNLSNENSFLIPEFPEERNSDTPFSILLEEFTDDNDSDVEKQEEPIISDHFTNNSSFSSILDGDLKQQIADCMGDQSKLIQLLSEKIIANKKLYDHELKRRKEEIDQLQKQFDINQSQLLEICKVITK